MALPDCRDRCWSVDFEADTLSWDRRSRIRCIVDDFTREAQALVVDTSIGGHRMARELEALEARRGNGPSVGPASRHTTPSSKPSTAASGRVPERLITRDSCGRGRKV